MTTRLHGRNVQEFLDLDAEQLLEKLTPEELEELNRWVDPDNSLLPPSERTSYKIDKLPGSTGKFNREALARYLEEEAKNEKDWDEPVPFQKATRGKLYQAKTIKQLPPSHNNLHSKRSGHHRAGSGRFESNGGGDVDIELDEELEEALKGASEKDLVDLAAFMGMHSVLNQVQYHNAHSQKGREDLERIGGTSFGSVVKAEPLKFVPPEPDNDTDVEKSIRLIESNESSLRDLNLNNIGDISNERFHRLFQGLARNSTLQTLSLANVHLGDNACRPLLDALRRNKSLRTLNLESNSLTGEMIYELLQTINEQQSITEFRAANQSAKQVLGSNLEMRIASLLEQNTKLLKLGLHFGSSGARARVNKHLQRNCDLLRMQRQGY